MPPIQSHPPSEECVSMKYRQPGYRDQDYKEEREKKRQEDHGPRGPREPRGMAREARLVMRCFQCGHQEPAAETIEAVAPRAQSHTPPPCCPQCIPFPPRAPFHCPRENPARIPSQNA